MKKEYKRLLATLIVLLGIALSFIIYAAWPLMTGKTIVLATRPVDPFDMFRGQYLTINYEITTIPLLEGAKEGSTVYALLEEDQEHIWRLKKAVLEKPKEGTFIKGKIQRVYENLWVEYGIEQYFFEKDAQFSTRNLTVEAKLSTDGQARIVRLLQDGKPIKMNYQNISLTR